jgi:hypothetical protein
MRSIQEKPPMQSLLDPAILFFVVGVIAGATRSKLEIPQPISRFLSLYLLMALGLKGGFALARSGLNSEVVASLSCAALLAFAVPLVGYRILRRFLSGFDAAAIAATYGSVSAVTFITASNFLDRGSIPYGGHMAAAMALMESPAIVLAIAFASALRRERETVDGVQLAGGGTSVLESPQMASGGLPLGRILAESFSDGAQLLLLAAMLIGILTGESGNAAMHSFIGDLFKGMLAFFLLDMGLLAARNCPPLRDIPKRLLLYGVLGPAAHATLALGLAAMLGLPVGDATLLMVLAASASYIAVPAVVRFAIPEAQPSLYFGMSLGVTFPLNILVGIPVYAAVARLALGTA